MKKRDFLKVVGGAALAPFLPEAFAGQAPASGAYLEAPGVAFPVTGDIPSGTYTLQYFLRRPGEEWHLHKHTVTITEDSVEGMEINPDIPMEVRDVQLWIPGLTKKI